MRYLRIARLYRLLRLSKLIKVFAKIRDESKLIVGIFEKFKISHSSERLAMFFVVFLLLCHILTCLMII